MRVMGALFSMRYVGVSSASSASIPVANKPPTGAAAVQVRIESRMTDETARLIR